MIRKYQAGDENRLEPNEFSDVAGFSIPTDYDGVTILTGVRVDIIAMWKEVSSGDYAAFILMGKSAGVGAFLELKRFIRHFAVMKKPRSIFTFSRKHPKLDRWHKFLGFLLENNGGILVEGKPFEKWVMTWDLKQ